MSDNEDSQQGENEGARSTTRPADLAEALHQLLVFRQRTRTRARARAHPVSGDDDEDLFKPPPPKEECPLCLLPFPNDIQGSTYCFYCCGNIVCAGCLLKEFAVNWWMNQKRKAKEPPEPPIVAACPFCRADADVSDEEQLQRLEKRMSRNDPSAVHAMAHAHADGDFGLPTDEDKAVELFLRAADLGSAEACFCIAERYTDGGSLGQDRSKELHYLRLAAKRGHVRARFALGALEGLQYNFELSVKHWMISAAAGHDDSLHKVGFSYRNKAAARAHQRAKNEMSSDERKMAEKAGEDNGFTNLSALTESEFASLAGVRKTKYAFFSHCYQYLPKYM